VSTFFVQRGPAFAGIGLDIDFEDPDAVQRELLQIENYLGDTLILAETAKAAMQVDMARHFDTETDPSGNPWAPLVREAFDQIGILQLTEEMREAAISDEAWSASPDGVTFDASVLPPYWHFHDVGSVRITRGPRRFIGVSDREADVIEKMGDAWLLAGIAGPTRRGAARKVRTPSGTFIPFG
jgi:hypothetical protein